MCDSCQLIGYDSDRATGEPFTETDDVVFQRLLAEADRMIGPRESMIATSMATRAYQCEGFYDRLAGMCIGIGCGAVVAQRIREKEGQFIVDDTPAAPYSQETIDKVVAVFNDPEDDQLGVEAVGSIFGELLNTGHIGNAALFLLGWYLVRTGRCREYVNIRPDAELEVLNERLKAEQGDSVADLLGISAGEDELRAKLMRMIREIQ